MLRTTFVLILIGIGAYFAVHTPFYALLFYIGNAYFRPEEWVWTDFVSSLRLSLISGIWVVLISLATRQRLVFNTRVALLWLFLFHTLISTLAAEDFSYSWRYWIDFLKTIVIAYMIVVLVTDAAKLRLIVLVMALALGLEQTKQGWFYLITSPEWHNENPVPFLGDNNGVAVGMLALVPLIGFLLQTAAEKRARAFYAIMMVGCLFRALSTHSRGGFLALIAMAGVWWMRSRHKLAGLLCGLAISAVVLPMLPDTFWGRMSTIQTFEKEQDQSALGRLHFWSVAIEMANAYPVLGVGYFGYNQAYDKHDFSRGQYGKWRSVHSGYFGVLAELGYVGATLYLVILLSALLSCSRVYKRSLRDPALQEERKCALSLQVSLIAYLVGAIFVSAQYSEMLWHLIALTIALERITSQASIKTPVVNSFPPTGSGGREARDRAIAAA